MTGTFWNIQIPGSGHVWKWVGNTIMTFEGDVHTGYDMRGIEAYLPEELCAGLR